MSTRPSVRKVAGSDQDELAEKIKQYAQAGSFDKIYESVAAFVDRKIEQGQANKTKR